MLKLNISKENKQFSIIYFLQNFVICLFFSYVVLYLKDTGYTESQIGTLMSVSTIVTILSQPLVGYISDQFISIKKIYMIISASMLFLVIAFPFIRENIVLLYVAYMFISLTGRSSNMAIDNYVTKLATIRSGLDFGFVRGIGSLGYAIIAIVSGYLISYFGYNILFILHTISMLALLFFTYRAEDLPAHVDKGAGKRVNFLAAMKLILKNKSFALFIASISIAWVGISASTTYIPVTIERIGGTSGSYGLAISLAALSEIPVLWNYYRLYRYASVETWLLISLCVYGLRMIIMLLFPYVPVVVASHALQSVSFGLFLPFFFRRIQDIVPPEFYSSALSVATSLYSGVGAMIGSFLGGIVLEDYGYTWFYVFCLTAIALGTITYFISIKVNAKKNVGTDV